MSLAHEKNISLLMIFEDEWRDKQEIVKSMIRHRLGLDQRKLGARSLFIKQVLSKEARQFFDENHIEGYAISKKTFGLYTSDNELVAAMSVRKAFHKSRRNFLEISKCCTKRDTTVNGWLGKLSKHTQREMNIELFTYVDSRVGFGKGYGKSGWSFVEMTKSPRFWWTDFNSRYNRFKFRADKSKNLTQREVAEQSNVVEIYGLKNLVFIYK